MLKKARKKKLIGGGNSEGVSLNIVLVGCLIFLLYQLTQIQGETVVRDRIVYKEQKPETIIKERIIYKEPEATVEEEQPYRDNVYIPDRRQARRTPPFNIRTRGPPEEYDMVGFLQDTTDTNKLQQLYGRQTYPNSNNWNYYIKSDQYHQIPIPISIDGQNCTDERGCKEITNSDSINLMNKDHTATIYKKEPFYYNPFVI